MGALVKNTASRFSRSRAGPEVCISNKVPGDADAAGTWLHLQEPRMEVAGLLG